MKKMTILLGALLATGCQEKESSGSLDDGVDEFPVSPETEEEQEPADEEEQDEEQEQEPSDEEEEQEECPEGVICVTPGCSRGHGNRGS